MARVRFRFLPGLGLAKCVGALHEYDNVRALITTTMAALDRARSLSITIIHGARDQVIPASMSRRLAHVVAETIYWTAQSRSNVPMVTTTTMTTTTTTAAAVAVAAADEATMATPVTATAAMTAAAAMEMMSETTAAAAMETSETTAAAAMEMSETTAAVAKSKPTITAGIHREAKVDAGVRARALVDAVDSSDELPVRVTYIQHPTAEHDLILDTARAQVWHAMMPCVSACVPPRA